MNEWGNLCTEEITYRKDPSFAYLGVSAMRQIYLELIENFIVF